MTSIFLSVGPAAAILECQVLRNLLKSCPRVITASLRAAACMVSVAMLLSFPSARTHLYGQHFGTTEIRQNIVRHTFVAGPEAAGVEKVARIDTKPSIPVTVIVENVAKNFAMPMVSAVPTFRILQHLRLGPSRSDSPDPLL